MSEVATWAARVSRALLVVMYERETSTALPAQVVAVPAGLQAAMALFSAWQQVDVPCVSEVLRAERLYVPLVCVLPVQLAVLVMVC